MTIETELKTIRDYIRYATTEFNKAGLYFGHGTNNALDDAVALLFHSLSLSHENVDLLDARLTTPERLKILDLIQKRVTQRIPVPYLTNEAYFAGFAFYVDERVLIPRSSFAELIENGFQPWLGSLEVNNILDLCTGSGCIAIACAKAFPYAEVDASDVSKDALTVAKINVLRHNVEDQVELYDSDLFQSLPRKKYDLIVSNPPYVSCVEMNALPAEYRYEPSMGLSGGEQGLDLVVRLLADASQYLTKDGMIIVEVGNSEVAITEQFPNVPFTWLEFERSEGGVFMLTAAELAQHQAEFQAAVR